ncbi:hypothetical protein NDU88_003840 [Pleurodeles waltl]|uniref:Uncharacterized protein n=1 Tax=Pleurodeles waltl TaxID=8319 RepID=A0AAV7SH59_PLEWA|nr:hypothetical protein NDU88_003840 [Pleurodeles waltl]
MRARCRVKEDMYSGKSHDYDDKLSQLVFSALAIFGYSRMLDHARRLLFRAITCQLRALLEIARGYPNSGGAPHMVAAAWPGAPRWRAQRSPDNQVRIPVIGGGVSAA